jgi:hypothetical protein
VADDPDVCVGKHERDIVVEVLKAKKRAQSTPPQAVGEVRKNGQTYRPHWVKEALLDKGSLETVLITFPATSVAITHCFPRPADACTTAAKQQIIVQLILLRGRPGVDPLCGRAFDGEDDSAVIIRREDVPSEPIVVRLPANWLVLRSRAIHQPQKIATR